MAKNRKKEPDWPRMGNFLMTCQSGTRSTSIKPRGPNPFSYCCMAMCTEEFDLERCCSCDMQQDQSLDLFPPPHKFVSKRGAAAGTSTVHVENETFCLKELHRHKESYCKAIGKILASTESANWSEGAITRKQAASALASLIAS